MLPVPCSELSSYQAACSSLFPCRSPFVCDLEKGARVLLLSSQITSWGWEEQQVILLKNILCIKHFGTQWGQNLDYCYFDCSIMVVTNLPKALHRERWTKDLNPVGLVSDSRLFITIAFPEKVVNWVSTDVDEERPQVTEGQILLTDTWVWILLQFSLNSSYMFTESMQNQSTHRSRDLHDLHTGRPLLKDIHLLLPNFCVLMCLFTCIGTLILTPSIQNILHFS